MSAPDPDPSVFHEPHMRGGPFGFQPDPSEERAARHAANTHKPSEDEQVEFSVWDEPGLSKELSGQPPVDGLTYADWLRRRMAQTGWGKTWLVTAAVALAAGPWAVLGALMSGGGSAFGFVVLVLIAPLTEEIMKTAAAMWVVEKRPYLFRSAAQIGLCGLASGLTFAAMENLLYLHVYVEAPSALLVWWRWTICTALHAGCTLLASVGLIRIWSDAVRHLARPRLALGAPFLVAAVAVHGLYNAFAVVIEWVMPF